MLDLMDTPSTAWKTALRRRLLALLVLVPLLGLATEVGWHHHHSGSDRDCYTCAFAKYGAVLDIDQSPEVDLCPSGPAEPVAAASVLTVEPGSDHPSRAPPARPVPQVSRLS